ncbi:hypothetical protein LTR08_004663 [Meristemomyces frigidus]|nr:hypothetical protein LTR08_004663 [Meristemomyces frigidus]
MSTSNRIKKVAIVGAGGNCGSYITEALLKTGKHTVTAITREDSTSKLPDGVNVIKIDYNNPASIVKALTSQDALVITMNARAVDTQPKLIQAAADAGVPWVLPNEWGVDTTNEGLLKDVPVFQEMPKIRKLIAKTGTSSYIAITTGFWFEWSLSIPAAFGFDFANRSIVLFDEGETKIATSTWPQVGRTVAALLSLPIKPEGDDKNYCLEHFKDGHMYVNSFTVSQKDMLASVLRVTRTKESDWKVTKEATPDRFQAGIAAMQKGDRMGFAQMMYTRVFYTDGSGDFEKTKGTVNELLGLPKEDIDEATKAAEERSKNFKWS